MTLPLSPPILRAAYEYLRTTPPFNRWSLPEGGEVEFLVIKTRDRYADHCLYTETGKHVIRVSSGVIGYSASLIAAMAHEMVHAKQAVAKTETRAQHNAEFHRLAKLVCKYHGFDPKTF